MQQSSDYPASEALMSGWFHQDVDIEGDMVEAIIGSFNKSNTIEDRQLLVSDIRNFLQIQDDHIDGEFIRVFNPDVLPTGFALTTRAFLEEILLHLSSHKNV